MERLHAVLHPRGSQPDHLQALRRAAVVGREQELHSADAAADREEREVSEHSLPARSQSLLGGVFCLHSQPRELLRADHQNREDGKRSAMAFKSFFLIFSSPHIQTPTIEELSLLSIQLASQFLFQFGFRTKKTLRGAAIEWYDDDMWYALVDVENFFLSFCFRRCVVLYFLPHVPNCLNSQPILMRALFASQVRGDQPTHPPLGRRPSLVRTKRSLESPKSTRRVHSRRVVAGHPSGVRQDHRLLLSLC